jgi:DNA-binding NarL/FixJ family response regulator
LALNRAMVDHGDWLAHVTRILIVDDHALIRRGITTALQQQVSFDAVWEASNAHAALELAAEQQIDVAIVDLFMPEMSGISLTSRLCELVPTCRVLALSVTDEPGLIADVFRAGAYGFAHKTQPITEIMNAIGVVLSGLRYLPTNISRSAVEAELVQRKRQPLRRLSKRECEVFELLIRGYVTDEIATRLFISRRTVETHRQRINSKLSPRSLVQMQRLAARHIGLSA